MSLYHRHCLHSMRQRLCNGMVSVRLFVPSIDRRLLIAAAAAAWRLAANASSVM